MRLSFEFLQKFHTRIASTVRHFTIGQRLKLIPTGVGEASSLAVQAARRDAPPEFSVPLSAYQTAMRRLESFETLPSCHRRTLGHLASDCSKLYASNSSPYADKHRMEVAVRIAVCEFEAAGVDFPLQCNVLESGTENDAKCIQALAKNPQLWTTLSNSLQTLLSACDSVRAETERSTSQTT